MIKNYYNKQIYDYFNKKIASKYYKIGDKLPSESEIEKMFNVSRAPVKHALDKLENEKVIQRLQGRGSFVISNEISEDWILMTGFQKEYIKEWKQISAQTVKIEKKRDIYFSNLLNIDIEKEMTHLKRIRYLNEIPILYLEHYVSPDIPLEVFKKDSSFFSMDKLLETEMNIEFVEIEESLEAVLPEVEVSKYLSIDSSTPILKGKRISYDTLSNPKDITVFYVKTDYWKYTVNYNRKGK